MNHRWEYWWALKSVHLFSRYHFLLGFETQFCYYYVMEIETRKISKSQRPIHTYKVQRSSFSQVLCPVWSLKLKFISRVTPHTPMIQRSQFFRILHFLKGSELDIFVEFTFHRNRIFQTILEWHRGRNFFKSHTPYVGLRNRVIHRAHVCPPWDK